jgi:multiple antibiotic resistance protein
MLETSWLTAANHFLFGGILGLLTITNPLSKVPLFITLTQKLDAQQTRNLARRACIYAFFIMVTTLFIGAIILNIFGISYGALRISGGFTIALLGYRMLFQSSDANFSPESSDNDYAFFPLALPSISGPGTIAVIIGISTEIAEQKNLVLRITAYASTIISMALTCISIWLVLRACKAIAKFLGKDGLEVTTRLMGFLLICVGVQFISSGITTLIANSAT